MKQGQCYSLSSAAWQLGTPLVAGLGFSHDLPSARARALVQPNERQGKEGSGNHQVPPNALKLQTPLAMDHGGGTTVLGESISQLELVSVEEARFD